MDFFRGVLQIVFLLLLICQIGGKTGGALSYRVICIGDLTVDQDIIAMGSNLTVQCRTHTEQCGTFLIELNRKTILKQDNCSVVTTHLVVREPKSVLGCKLQQDGKTLIVCGRDIVTKLIPHPPQITRVFFTKGALSATILWQSPEDSEPLKTRLRFRKTHDASDWMERNVTQIDRGELVMLEELEPLTSYQFELRVCTEEFNCSIWSDPVIQSSPRKAPLNKLDVWRVITKNEESNTQNVTVFWKASTLEDHQEGLQGYVLVYQKNGITHTVNSSADICRSTLRLHPDVTELFVSAVTTAGNSPPAHVSLIHTGRQAPAVYINPAAGGGIELFWNSYSYTSEEVLGFVVEWQCGPLEMRWKRMGKDQNSTVIKDTPACIVYNVSLYVESTDGVSWASFGQMKKTTDIPKPSGNPVIKPGLISHQTSNSNNWWLKGGLVVGICLMTAVPIIIIVNIMYLRCARQRIRKMCMLMGPSWLFENLPKLANSNAIKLLMDEKCGSDLCWQPVDSDPPLSPVEDFTPPTERKDPYPIVHIENITEERKNVQNWTVCPYKPQVSIVSQREESISEAVEKDEDEHSWVFFPSPAISKFDDEDFLPSHVMNEPLNSGLTLDGKPISMDDIGGLLFLSQTISDGNIWMEGDRMFMENENGEHNHYQEQTVLPNDLQMCLREPILMPNPIFTYGK